MKEEERISLIKAIENLSHKLGKYQKNIEGTKSLKTAKILERSRQNISDIEDEIEVGEKGIEKAIGELNKIKKEMLSKFFYRNFGPYYGS